MFGLFDKLKKLILNKYLKSTIRHLTSSLGTWLIVIGLDSEQVGEFIPLATEIITGIGLYLVAQLLSFGDKKKNQDD